MFTSIRKLLRKLFESDFKSKDTTAIKPQTKMRISAAQATILTEQARQDQERELLESVLDAIKHYAGRGLNSVSVTRMSGPPYDSQSIQTVLTHLALLGYTARFSDNTFLVEWNAKT